VSTRIREAVSACSSTLPASRFPPPVLQRGVNLIELIIAIVVISIAVSGVLLVFTQAVRFSADPMVQTQAIAIAEAYLDEILARPVTDPDAGSETRANFDNVGDYAAIVDQPPTDQNGIPLPGLGDYRVTVAVTPNVSLGPAGAAVPASRIDVTVTHSTVVNFTLTGYRANDA
jgi:MSHA pilin protein MshD